MIVGAMLGAILFSSTAPPAQGQDQGQIDNHDPVGERPAIEAAGLVIDAHTFDALTAMLPGAFRADARSSPEGFVEGMVALLEAPPAYSVLVDRDNALPPDYEPDDLVALIEHEPELELNPRTRASLSLTRDTLEALLELDAAADQAGLSLLVSSTYRSYSYQENLFAYWVSEMGLEEASRISARAGTSQHQLGTTVDFGCVCPDFADTPEGRWLAANAHRFGFSLSYPEGYESLTGYSYESWHFRYMGRDILQFEQKYFGGLQQHMLEYFKNTVWIWQLLYSFPGYSLPGTAQASQKLPVREQPVARGRFARFQYLIFSVIV